MKYLFISNHPLINILFLALLSSLISGKNTTIILWIICVIMKVVKLTNLKDAALQSENVQNTDVQFRDHGFQVTSSQQDIVNHAGYDRDPPISGGFQKSLYDMSLNIIGFLAILSFFLPFDVYVRHSDHISLSFLPVYYYQHNPDDVYKRGLEVSLLNKDYICVHCHILNDVKYGIVITVPVNVFYGFSDVDQTPEHQESEEVKIANPG